MHRLALNPTLRPNRSISVSKVEEEETLKVRSLKSSGAVFTQAVTLRNQMLRGRSKKSELGASLPQRAACCTNTSAMSPHLQRSAVAIANVEATYGHGIATTHTITPIAHAFMDSAVPASSWPARHIGRPIAMSHMDFQVNSNKSRGSILRGLRMPSMAKTCTPASRAAVSPFFK